MKREITGAQAKILIENGGKEIGGDAWSRGAERNIGTCGE